LVFDARLLALGQWPQGSAEEDRESMDAGPDRVLDVRATSGPEDSGADEVVEAGLQELERRRLGGFWTAGVVGDRERGSNRPGSVRANSR
jgi:hypothetical protein